jgi:hypothetical protein
MSSIASVMSHKYMDLYTPFVVDYVHVTTGDAGHSE